ncbi:MAG: flagellar biosynthesis protein FlhB [Candidatus Aureabacteria bacterium]|nr:flagellar biosynthesis protein FlhB [Candidatus Auribacterota bacterium]
MPEDVFKEDKTERATGKKRQNVREQGNVVMSMEVNTLAVILFTSLILYAFGSYILNNFLNVYKTSFALASTFRVTPLNIPKLCFEYIIYTSLILAPVLFFVLFFGITTSLLQIGWLWTFKPLRPKWNKIKPDIKKLNIFKAEKLMMLLVDLAKLAVIAPIAFYTVKGELHNIIPFVDKPIFYTWVFVMKLGFKVVLRVCIVFIFIAAADYVWKWWKHEEDIKMTKEEVKQERKDLEGDPKIKSWQKRQRFEMFRRFMMAKVPEADVVITNPTLFAVAVKYDELRMHAPQVIAKGMRKVAERIKEIAREHDIPIVENKPLAQALYHDVDVGQEIPASFYKAVAEVLAYVFKLKNKKVRV